MEVEIEVDIGKDLVKCLEYGIGWWKTEKYSGKWSLKLADWDGGGELEMDF